MIVYWRRPVNREAQVWRPDRADKGGPGGEAPGKL